MKYLSFAFGLLCLVFSVPAAAQDYPDYLSVGGGLYDFDKSDTHRYSDDYRVEYEWGMSLLPMIDDSFNSVEPYMQVHPTLGIEGNTKGAFMGEGGFDLDVLLFRHAIFTWGESVGAFDPGNDQRTLGSILQFRSQLELGWQFDSRLRITGFISHISNAHILNDDPGAEIIGGYLHIPLYGSGQE